MTKARKAHLSRLFGWLKHHLLAKKTGGRDAASSQEALDRGQERPELEAQRPRQSTDELDQELLSISDAMVLSSLSDGRILEVNETFQARFGYSRNEVLGKTGVELRLWVQPEDRAMMSHLLRERGLVRDLELTLTDKSGESSPALLSGEIVDREGQACLLMVLRDADETSC